MDELERLLKELRDGNTCLMSAPLGTDIRMAEKEVRAFGLEHGMALSIVPMVTDEDQKLAIGPGIPIETFDSR